jgi:outer membrane lipoprotein-sorting protein
MTHHRFQTLILAAVMLCSAATAQNLQAVLSKLDQSSAGFKGLVADVKKVSYTNVIQDKSEESGRITLFRPKPKDLRMLVEFRQPDPRAVAFANRKAQIFYPKILTVQEYDLGKQGALVDQFLLLGFGTSGRELLSSYDIKYSGGEAIGGVKAQRLELVPKSEEARQHVRRIEMWISDSDGVPVQQKVHQPSKDYVLITYSAMQLNPTLTADSVKLKLPKGVKKEYPQK